MTEKNPDDEQQATDEELAPDDSTLEEDSDNETAIAEVDAEDEDADFDRDGQAETPPSPVRTPRPRVRNPSRRTINREDRRRRSHARRARKKTVYGILGGIVAATLILGLAVPSFAGLITPSQDGGDSSGDTASVGTPIAVQPSSVLTDGEAFTAYASNPPTSGPSYATGVEWGVYDAQQPNEAVVRNLEQGAVVVNHNLTDEAQVADLAAYLEEQPGYPGCFILQPHSAVALGSTTLTSWGWMQTFTAVDRPGMQQFVDDHRNDAPQFQGQTCGADTTLPAADSVDHAGN